MKKTILFLFTLLISGISININAQESSIKASIDSVNAILKANPFYDGFNEVSFPNAVSISQDRELVVDMDFNGPFRWVYKAKISELDLTLRNDPCRESPSSVCWTCKKTGGTPGNCITAEMIMSDGGSQKENASNICVSFSARKGICNDIYLRISRLLNRVSAENQ